MAHAEAALLQVMAIDGSGAPCSVTLDHSPFTIGRDATNDLVIKDAGMSRHHLRLSATGSAWWVERLPQSAPIFVNGAAQDAGTLEHGDQIVTGGTIFRLMLPTVGGSTASGTPGRRAGQTALSPVHAPTLAVQFPDGAFEVPLRGRAMTLGRAHESGILIPSAIVSAQHAILRQSPSGDYVIEDLGSLNGLYYQGARIQSHPLRPGDIVTLGPPGRDDTVTLSYTSPPTRTGSNPVLLPSGSATVIIGRDPACDYPLSNPQVSRYHAWLTRDPLGRHLLTDLGSTNGTYVNHLRITEPHVLVPGDRVTIGLTEFTFEGTQLIPVSRAGGMRVDALDLVRVVGRERRVVLDHVTLPIRPGEFLAIVGGNGAGKSTLLRALVGLEPAQGGSVLFDGVDSYAHADALRGAIGYVPQADIVHGALTVERALFYAARLRLADDITEQEIEQRITAVLAALDLTPQRDKVIGSRELSGGQKKRVSIAVELLAEPPILFLDEPEAALDPLRRQEVFEVLRQLADRGQTVVLVTHHPETKIDLCDRVAVMGYGGRLCYLGPPAEAPTFFGVPDFVSIYGQIEADGKVQRWRDRFQQSAYYQHEVLAYLPPAGRTPVPGSTDLPAVHSRGGWNAREAARRRSSLAQMSLLIARYVDVFFRDRWNLTILLAQAPLIALVLAVLSTSRAFVLSSGPFEAQKVLFFLAIVAVWFGTINAVREICKESDIYERERLAGLGIAPYIISKAVVLGVLCLVQTGVLLLVVTAKTGLPPDGAGIIFTPAVELYIGIALAGLAGLAMGLCVSALASNPDRAVALVPLILLPQILLGGVIFPLTGSTQVVGDVTVTRWAVQALGTSADLDHLYYTQQARITQIMAAGGAPAAAPPSFAPTDFDNDPQISQYTTSVAAGASWHDAVASRAAHLWLAWGVLAAMTVGFVALAGWRLRTKDPVARHA